MPLSTTFVNSSKLKAVVPTADLAEEGMATITVVSTQTSNGAAFTVNDATIEASGKSATFTEGTSSSGVVATFTDDDPNGTASDYTATIVWDGSQTSNGSIVANGSGGFDVTGTNTYAEEGTYQLSVTINDVGGSSATVTPHLTVADAPLSATAVNIQATEGSPFSGTVAAFSDADPNGTLGDYTATIKWTNGQTSAGTISSDGAGGYLVSGSTTYAEEGTYQLSVTIRDAGGSSITVSPTASVADASLSATGQTVQTTEGLTSNLMLATFTDADPKGQVADFSATINWSDGSASTGTVSSNGDSGFKLHASLRLR